LNANPGAWTKGAVLTYQRIRSGSLLKGATTATYIFSVADRGAGIAVQTTGSLAGFTAASFKSPTVLVR
jgi:hypothetical protein